DYGHHQQPGTWLCHGGDADESAVLSVRLPDRHIDRGIAGHWPDRDHRDAVAGHLQPEPARRTEHARRHLLRRTVRRLDNGHIGQLAPRILVRRDMYRRLPHGPEGPRRRGTRRGCGWLLLRWNGRHHP